MLKQHGPLFVITQEPQGPHVRVITGISGDGTPLGTVLHINDPDPGTNLSYSEPFNKFIPKYEANGDILGAVKDRFFLPLIGHLP